MDFDLIRKSAETIMDGWGTLPVAYDNVDFDSQAQDDWARVTILDGDTFNTSLGGKCQRATGIITIQLFTKQGSGSASIRGWAKELSVLFTNIIDGNIVYEVASITRVGHSNDFYQINVDIPFYLDEVT